MAHNSNAAQPIVQNQNPNLISNPNLNQNQNPNQIQNQNQNNNLTLDVISRLIATSNDNLRTQINTLQTQLILLTPPSSVESYKTEVVDESKLCYEPLDMIMALPEFNSKANAYVSWREASHNAMTLI